MWFIYAVSIKEPISSPHIRPHQPLSHLHFLRELERELDSKSDTERCSDNNEAIKLEFDLLVEMLMNDRYLANS